jgi:hypothetical protein
MDITELGSGLLLLKEPMKLSKEALLRIKNLQPLGKLSSHE